MNSEQREVARWWHSGKEYQQGVMLLAMFSKNKVLVHTLMKQSEKYGRGKLDYELPKAVGMDWHKMPKADAVAEQQLKMENGNLEIEEPETSNQQPVTSNQQPSFDCAQDDEKPTSSIQHPETSYPAVIRRLKYEYSDLYNKRSILHKQMGGVPTANTPINMNQRAELLTKIKATTTRMDYLYGFEQAYTEKGIVPLEEEIWPPDAKPEEMPADAEGLKKLKKNLQTYNSKARNILQYQEKTKTKQEHPMPKGPKRQRIEIGIKHREELIEEIERRLFEIEQGGIRN
jgi:hypothetical protein